MRFGAYSDKGRVREANEDNFYISEVNKEYCFFIVADGMGGHNSGEIASKIAIEEISHFLDNTYDSSMSHKDICMLVRKSIQIANTSIFSSAKEEEEYNGMGTTSVLCFVKDKTAYIANVGDSRAYIIRNNVIQKLTTDHSVVEELINSGSITEEQAKDHPQRNVITRALGGDIDVKTDIIKKDILNDDIFLLCSDGLTNMLSDEEILGIINQYSNLQDAAKALVDNANSKGGIDNITVILFVFECNEVNNQ